MGLEDLKKQAEEGLEKAAHAAKEKAEEAKDKLTELAGEAKDKAKEAAHAAQARIEVPARLRYQVPWKSSAPGGMRSRGCSHAQSSATG